MPAIRRSCRDGRSVTGSAPGRVGLREDRGRNIFDGPRHEQRRAADHADLRLAIFMDNSHSEIAKHLGLPLGTVKSRIRNAMTKLRLILAPSEEAAR